MCFSFNWKIKIREKGALLETSRNPLGSATAILMLHGQCYDGCSTMAGTRGGGAAKVWKIEPMAVFYTLL